MYRLSSLIITIFLFTASHSAHAESGYGGVKLCSLGTWVKLLTPHPQKVKKVQSYKLGKKTIYAYQFGIIKGNRAKILLFAHVKDGCFMKVVSLGTYEPTTKFARQVGQIKKNERLYHLDLYLGGSHSTLGFLRKPLSYNDFKKVADKYLSR